MRVILIQSVEVLNRTKRLSLLQVTGTLPACPTEVEHPFGLELKYQLWVSGLPAFRLELRRHPEVQDGRPWNLSASITVGPMSCNKNVYVYVHIRT